ncbi:hypothetical protein D3C79_542460 [compost metagenome]
MGLHDPGAVLLIRQAVVTRLEVGVLVRRARLHADRVLGVTADDGVQGAGRQCTRHLHIPGRIAAMLAIFVVTHVGDGQDQVRLFVVADLLAELGRFSGRIAELQGLDVVGVHQLGGVFGGQAQHGNLETALQLEHLVGIEIALAAGLVVDVGGDHGELGPLTLFLQDGQRVVELVVTHRHGIVADAVHGHEVRLGILQIRLGHPGVHVATGEYQHLAASRLGLATQALDQGLLGSHAIFTLVVVPETTVGIIGVQNGQLADIFGAGGDAVIA